MSGSRDPGRSAPPGGLRLVPVRSDHAQLWWQWRQEPITRRFNPLRDLTIDELSSRLAVTGSDLRDRSRLEYRWMVQAGDELIGTVSLVNCSWSLGHGEITYMLAEAWHGRGLGTAAVGLFVDKLFAETTLVRLIASISAGHVASCRLVEKLGFVQEGILRQHHILHGQRVDQLVYGLLRHEWSARR